MSGQMLLVIIGTLVLASLTVTMFAVSSPAERRLRKRLKSVSVSEDKPVKGAAAHVDLRARRNGKVETGLVSLVPNLDILRQRVARAGLDIGLSKLLAIIAFVCVAFAMFFNGVTNLPPIIATVLGVAVGLLFPAMFISAKARARVSEFLATLPDGIDLMVRSVRSGLPVSEAVHAVAKELSGPAGEEFSRISDQIKLGVPMEEAMEKAARRMGAPDFAFLVIAISIQKETGGNLGEALSNLSTLLRQRQQMKMKVRALSSEARASALIIGSLPFIVAAILMLINPSYMDSLLVDPRGHNLLYAGGTSMGLGILVMARMVRFEI